MRATGYLTAISMMTLLTTGAMAAVSTADKTFATEAAQGGLAEVAMGQLALEKGSSPQVKQFAQRMVTDHTQANKELMQLATSDNLVLPTKVDSKQKADMDRLRGMSGAAFDTAYMQHMVQDHETDVGQFQKQSQSGGDPALKSFATKYLPVLQQHLQMAQATASKD